DGLEAGGLAPAGRQVRLGRYRLKQQEVRHAQVSNPGFLHGGRCAGTPKGRRIKAEGRGRASDQGLGGRLEAFYFAFGDTDVFANLRRPSMRPSITDWPPELFSDWG